MWGGLLVGDSPVCPRRRGSGQPRGHVAHGLGRTPAGSPGASVVAPPAGVSQAGWSSPCPARCPEGELGERPNPNPEGTEPGSHQDPHTCPTCPLPRGSPSSPRLSRQVWAQTLSFGRPTQRHFPFPGPPVHPARVGHSRTPHSGGLPPSWPYFPRLGGLGAGGGGECQPGLRATGPRPQLPSTGGCHSATEQPGTGHRAPARPPCAPLPALGRGWWLCG